MNRSTCTASLVVALALLFVVAGQVRVAQAASVTLPVKVTMDNSAASATVTISGCNPSPTTLASDGTAHSISIDASCPFTLSFSNSGNSRDGFLVSGAFSASSASQTSCAAPGPCTELDLTAYLQLSNTYQVTANAQSTFDTGMSWPVTGNSLGSSSTICTIYSTTGTSDFCTAWSDYGRSVTIQQAAANPPANSRWQSSGCSTTQTTGGNTYNCNSYKQWSTTWSAAAAARSSFDTSMTSTVSGNQFGTSASLCTIVTSSGHSSDTCSAYIDNSASASFSTTLGSAPANEQWGCAVCTTASVTSGGTTQTVKYYAQLVNTYQVTAKAQATFDSGMAWGVTGTSLGASSTICTITSTAASLDSCSGYADYGSTVTISQTAGSPPSNSRWQSPSACTFAQTAAGNTNNCNSYKQWSNQFAYSVVGGGTPTPPAFSASQFGAAVQSTLSTAMTTIWVDNGATCTVTNPTTGSTSFERWHTGAACPTATSGGGSTSFDYYHQYGVSASYSVNGGGVGYTGPSLILRSGGISNSSAVTQLPTQFWADSGSSWSVDSQLSGGSSTERWETDAATSGAVASPVTLTLTYFHQYFVTFGFGVIGGGSGYLPPSVAVSQFGSQVSELSGWADAGSPYSFTNPLNGSTSAQRWYAGAAHGVVSSSSTVNATYYRQYDMLLAYKVVGTRTQLPPPTLDSTALGLPFSAALRTSPADNWVDSGSHWGVSPLLQGSGSSERWMTDQVTSGTAITSTTMTLEYFDQYAAGFGYSVQGGGSPPPPSLNYSSFSANVTTPLNSTRLVYWLDSGSGWSLTNPVMGQSGSERWIASKGTSGTASEPFNETATYSHQYFLSLKPNDGAGGTVGASSDWRDAGSGVLLNATASTGWRFVGWTGQGVGSYSGPNQTQRISLGSGVNETAVFYAGLSLSSGDGGSVQYRTGQLNGSVSGGSAKTLYVAPGTKVDLASTPATVAYVFTGWSGKLAGSARNATLTVTSPLSVSASFGLDYADIGAFYAVTIVVLVLAVYVFVVRRRHMVFGSGRPLVSAG